jgi:hypothetical protein
MQAKNSHRSWAGVAALSVGIVILLGVWFSAGSAREEGAYWPLLLFALCPLLHLFMHRSHGGGDARHQHD